MDAIVIAGGVPEPGEPLYEYTQGQPKALLDICGKPMVQWVLDALEGAEGVETIIVIGLSSDSSLTSQKVSAYLPSQGNMVSNIVAAVNKLLELKPSAHHTLLVSADIPGITPQVVEWIMKAAMQSDDDIYYTVIERQVMEARYPHSRRTYTKLKGIELCGGDINALHTSIVANRLELWDRIIASRKNALKQAALIGYDTLILLLLRLITLDGAVKRASKRLNMKGRVVVCPYAEAGMDVDKPSQLEMMRADLAQQLAKRGT